MKLSPLLLTASLTANAALLGLLLHRGTVFSRTAPALVSTRSNSPATDQPHHDAAALADPNASAHSVIQNWSAVGASDFRTLAANLRAAGFPPSVVRAIVKAQIVEHLRPALEAQLAAIGIKAFWQTDKNYRGNSPDPQVAAVIRDSDRDQLRLLNEAFGDASSDVAISDAERRQYGALSREKIDRLQQLETDYTDRRQAIHLRANGALLPEDRENLAALADEKRASLEKILSPSELDDFLARSTITATRLRPMLGAMNATEEEFRAIYQAESAYDKIYRSDLPPPTFLAASIQERQNAQQAEADAQAQVTAQLKLALGEQRFADYSRSSDAEFQTISRLAQQAGLPPTAANNVYALRENAGKESNRIYADSALTADQKQAAAQSLAQTTRTQILSALGSDAGRSYLEFADRRWLTAIERGSAVTFRVNGMSSRGAPQSRLPGGAAPAPRSAAPSPARINVVP